MPLLFLSTLLMGIGFAAMGPARQAWLAELIPRPLLANGVALQQMAQNMARVLGPTLASVVAIVFGLSSGYLYILVAGFFVVVVPLTTALPWTPPPGRREDRRSVPQDLAAGFAYLWSNRRLRILWMFWMLIVVCSFAINTLLPGILDREYGRSPNDALPVFLVFGVASLVVNIPLAGAGRRSPRLADPAAVWGRDGSGILADRGRADLRDDHRDGRDRRGRQLRRDAGQPGTDDDQFAARISGPGDVVHHARLRLAVVPCASLGWARRMDRRVARRSRWLA